MKKKVVKQKQKQQQKQSVKINISNPVKRVYSSNATSGSKSKSSNKQPIFPTYFPNQPIVNVTIPNIERSIQAGLEPTVTLLENIGNKLNEPIKNKITKEIQNQTDINFIPLQESEPKLKQKIKKIYKKIKKPLIIEGSIATQTDTNFIPLKESKPSLEEPKNIKIKKNKEIETQTNIIVPKLPEPILKKQPSFQKIKIVDLKKEYILATGDIKGAKKINKTNKQDYIDLIKNKRQPEIIQDINTKEVNYENIPFQQEEITNIV